MKKLFALLLAVLMLASMMAGCVAADDNGPGQNTYNLKTVREGYLTVATSPDYAPFEFYALDEAGKPTLAGFDVALAQYIADYLGLTLDIIPMDFDGTLSELESKHVDLSMAGYSPNPDRADAMDFSMIYYTSEQSFVTVKDKLANFPDLASANKSDVKIGVQLGSIQVGLAEDNTPDAELIKLSKITDIIAELVSGKLDGAYIETPVVQAYTNSYPTLSIAATVPNDSDGTVIGVSKGNEDLLKYVNEAVAKAIADGDFAKYVAQATDLAAGNTYEGVLDENGNVPTEG